MGNGRGDERRITERSEIDEGGNVEAIDRSCRDHQAQARLTDAARPEQRQQADVGLVKQCESGRSFPFAADKWRRWDGEASGHRTDDTRRESLFTVSSRL